MNIRRKYGRADKYRNLTRYTRDRTSFQGWRVCICRQRAMFTKYIPDSAYNDNGDESEAAARALRDEILEELNTRPAEVVFAEYRDKYTKKKKSKKNAEKGADEKRGSATD